MARKQVKIAKHSICLLFVAQNHFIVQIIIFFLQGIRVESKGRRGRGMEEENLCKHYECNPHSICSNKLKFLPSKVKCGFYTEKHILIHKIRCFNFLSLDCL